MLDLSRVTVEDLVRELFRREPGMLLVGCWVPSPPGSKLAYGHHEYRVVPDLQWDTLPGVMRITADELEREWSGSEL